MKKENKGIIFQCEKCAATLRAPEHTTSKQGRCPQCHHWVALPEKSTINK